MGQAAATTRFLCHGREHFTRTGWERASATYPPGVMESADLKGRVFVITGANSGVGFEVAGYAAAKGARVWLLCRNAERAEAARGRIAERVQQNHGAEADIRIIIGDCAVKADVRRVAAEISEQEPSGIDGLVCNAGALLSNRTETAEGLEVTVASHLVVGCYLLGTLLLPALRRTAEPRVVLVSSGGMYNTKFPSWQTATARHGKYDGQLAYAYAKRGQVLLAEHWAHQHPDVAFVSCHPGWVDTPGVDAAYGDKKKWLEPLRTPWQGAEGIAWLLVARKAEISSGAFYLDRAPQAKYLTGWGFNDYTKNTESEVQEMMRAMENECRQRNENERTCNEPVQS